MKVRDIVFATLAFTSVYTSCDKESPIGPQVIPSSVFFLIKSNGGRLSDATLDGMRLFYYRSGVKSYVGDFGRATEEGRVLGVQTTRSVGFLSGDENIKDYYLEFPSGDIDTLIIDYKRLDERAAFQNRCYCYYPLEQVKYNNTLATLDSTITQQRVYKFTKY